jgi:hypothetical protein
MPTCFNYLAVDRSMHVYVPISSWDADAMEKPRGVQSVLMPQVTWRAATIPASWPLNLPGWVALFQFQRWPARQLLLCSERRWYHSECINGCFGKNSPSLTEPHRATQRQQEPLAAGQSGKVAVFCGRDFCCDLVISRGSMDHGSLEKRRNISRHALIINYTYVYI